MGLSSKQVSTDGVVSWNRALLQDQSVHLSKPQQSMKRQTQTQQEGERLKCPRCDSSNTKFCYYNNYNKSQPRHFCKTCKRHWTKGGTLRNVPVGGGRKNKRIKTTSSSTSTKVNTPQIQTPIGFTFTDQQQQSTTLPLNQNQALFLPHSNSLASFNTTPNVYNYTAETENVDDPIITGVESTTTSYWNWDDIDTFASIDISNWVDDHHFKP